MEEKSFSTLSLVVIITVVESVHAEENNIGQAWGESRPFEEHDSGFRPKEKVTELRKCAVASVLKMWLAAVISS
jgi:hypothetical protein